MINGPDSRYMMMWAGEWRAVTHMLTSANKDTDNVLRAVKAVLFIDEDTWVATVVQPGDIIERLQKRSDDDARFEDLEPLTIPEWGY